MDTTEQKDYVVTVDGQRHSSHVTEAQAVETKKKLTEKLKESDPAPAPEVKVVQNLFG